MHITINGEDEQIEKWTKFNLPAPGKDNKVWYEVNDWLQQNIKCGFYIGLDDVCFKNEKEAFNEYFNI